MRYRVLSSIALAPWQPWSAEVRRLSRGKTAPRTFDLAVEWMQATAPDQGGKMTRLQSSAQ